MLWRILRLFRRPRRSDPLAAARMQAFGFRLASWCPGWSDRGAPRGWQRWARIIEGGELNPEWIAKRVN